MSGNGNVIKMRRPKKDRRSDNVGSGTDRGPTAAVHIEGGGAQALVKRSGTRLFERANMTFDNFIETEGNVFAVSMARIVAQEGRSSSYSSTDGPLFIHGSAGSGKTHLLTAILNGAPDWSSLMVGGPELVASYDRALECDATVAWAKRLLGPQILVLDDIDRWEGRIDLQRELFAILYQRIRGDKAVVVGSRRGPEELDGYDRRLASLLRSGSAGLLEVSRRDTCLQTIREVFPQAELPPELITYVLDLVERSPDSVRTTVERLRNVEELGRALSSLGYRCSGQLDQTDAGRAGGMVRWIGRRGEKASMIDLEYDVGSSEVVSVTHVCASAPMVDRIGSALGLGFDTTTGTTGDCSEINPGDGVEYPGEGVDSPAGHPHAARFKERIKRADSRHEQLLVLKSALVVRMRQLREQGGDPAFIRRLASAFELLREGDVEAGFAVLAG